MKSKSRGQTPIKPKSGGKAPKGPALRDGAQHLSLIFQNTFDAMALYGVEGKGRYRMLAVNQALLKEASRRVGKPVTEDQVVGKPFDIVLRHVFCADPASIERSLHYLEEAVKTGAVIRWNDFPDRPTGRFASERTDIPIPDSRGRCRHVLRVVHDITERILADEEQASLVQRMRRQSEMILGYSIDPAVAGGDVSRAAQRLTEIATQALGVELASVWMFGGEGKILRCVDRYRQSARRHSQLDFPLDITEFPETFASVSEGRVLAAEDIARDPRTARLAARINEVFAQIGEEPPSTVLTMAVRVRGTIVGFIWMATVGQKRQWRPDEIAFCGALGDHFALTVQNSEREQAALDLRSLAGQLMRVQDEERRRIARDLHDSTGQLLASLEINMAMLSRAAGNLEERPRQLLQDCIAQTRLCADSIRTASYLLHPPLLDEMGLVAAIRWHLEGFRHRSGVQIKADLSADGARLPPEDELSLFRVLQESLTNIHRHSGATSARVALVRTPSEVTLTISDDGHGIARENLARFREGRSTLGIGLAGMRERMRQIGGRLDIRSAAGQTEVTAAVPLRGASEPGPVGPLPP
jgi:signal transduction histidine kinase